MGNQMTSNVIDLKTREPYRIAQHEPAPAPTDAERVDHLAGNCETVMLRAAQMLRAALGLDATLRALGRVNTAVREE